MRILSALWGSFVLAVLIVTTYFLQVTIKDQQAHIPNLNTQLFEFIYISHWILVGVASLALLVGMFGGTRIVFASFGMSSMHKPTDEMMTDTKNNMSVKKRSDPYHFIAQ